MNTDQITHAILSGLAIVAATALAITGHISGDATVGLILACVGITGALTVPARAAAPAPVDPPAPPAPPAAVLAVPVAPPAAVA